MYSYDALTATLPFHTHTHTHTQLHSKLSPAARDRITANLFIPQIILPTRITSRSKTLIDNIFSNCFDSSFVSGNITTSISDHLPQFLLIPNINIKDLLPKKHNLFKSDMKNFNKEDFILDLLEVDWDQTLQINNNDPNFSFENFYQKVNGIIDTYL